MKPALLCIMWMCVTECLFVGGVNMRVHLYVCVWEGWIFVCVCVHGPVQPVGMATQPKTGEMGSGVSGDTDPVKCEQDWRHLRIEPAKQELL